MSKDFRSELSSILNGATITSATLADDSNVIVAELTASQASKLSAMDITINPVSFKGNRVIVELDFEEIKVAYESNKKAPRSSSSVNVEVSTRTIYEVRTDGVNEVSSAWLDKVTFDGADITGGVVINGETYEVYLGQASEYYEIGENSDPTRTVYVVDLPIAGSVHQLTSYGLTNLLRSVCKIGETIG